MAQKIYILRSPWLNRTLDLLFSCPKNVVAVLYIVRQKHRFEIFIWTMMVKRGENTYKNSVIFVISYWTIMHFKRYKIKGQKILKQNCRAVTSPRKQTNLFFFPLDLEILATWISISSFKYFWVKKKKKK